MENAVDLLRQLADLIERLPPGAELDACVRAAAALVVLAAAEQQRQRLVAAGPPPHRNGHAIEPPPPVTVWPMPRAELSA
jgi:hypothetical protein